MYIGVVYSQQMVRQLQLLELTQLIVQTTRTELPVPSRNYGFYYNLKFLGTVQEKVAEERRLTTYSSNHS